MDSNSRYQLQQQQPNSGLLRFRSAPSSVLSNLAQGGAGNSSSSGMNNKGNTNSSTTPPWDNGPSSEPDRLVLRFLNSNDNSSNMDAASPSLREFQDKPSDNSNNNNNNNKDCSITPSLSLMNSHQQQGYVPSRFMRHGSNSNAAASSMDCSFGLMGSVGIDLHRQSSFPPAATGHFSSNISFQNGYDSMKGVGNYDGVNGSDSSELSLSMNRVNNQISFSSSSSSRGPSSLGILSKLGSEGGANNNNNNNNNNGGFHYGSWNNNNETLHLSEKLSSKRDRSSSDKLFSDVHDGELGLSHQLSFSKASSDIFAMENMIQFPADSVPCKIRAKRGCATHPRSIAERVRRTRISERMRKLQELVPNMDKQTSTAEMLDLAVVYIKDLQKQFKKLSEKRAKCKCISMQNSDSNHTA